MTKRIYIEASPDPEHEGLPPREVIALIRDCDEVEFCTFGGGTPPRPQRVVIEGGKAVVRFYN